MLDDCLFLPLSLRGLRYLLLWVDVGRSTEAKVEYEKLVSHPNLAVRKKARQFLFGFQVLILQRSKQFPGVSEVTGWFRQPVTETTF